ncbi:MULTISPECIES: hypothetical protein, partial [unclassified Burkholderia]|uniref:hypothetical protein n=1 Tax=Burkholderia sp. LMG 13014 TaxID=2709306 RepID=UPI001963E478
MASPEEGPGGGALKFANDRAMTARAPQSAIRAIALRDVRNDDGWNRCGDAAGRPLKNGPRVYRRCGRAIARPTVGDHLNAIMSKYQHV